MRYGPDDKFWLVLDAGSESTMDDLVLEASIRDLQLLFQGGLTMDVNPTIFTKRADALAEARCRLVAMRASKAVARHGSEKPLNDVVVVKLLDADGNVVLEAWI